MLVFYYLMVDHLLESVSMQKMVNEVAILLCMRFWALKGYAEESSYFNFVYWQKEEILLWRSADTLQRKSEAQDG